MLPYTINRPSTGLFNPLSKGLLSDEGCGLGLPSEVQYTNLHCLKSFKQWCHRNRGPCDGKGLCGRQGGAHAKSLSSSVPVKMGLQGGETFLQPIQPKVGLFAFECRIQADCRVLPGCQTPTSNPFFLVLHRPVHAHWTAVPGRLSEWPRSSARWAADTCTKNISELCTTGIIQDDAVETHLNKSFLYY